MVIVNPNSNDASPLFAAYNSNEKSTKMGRYFKRFMKQNSKITFTTTSARALHETTAMDAAASGLITRQEADAFMDINGHSSSISKLHYRKLNMTNATNNCMRAFGIMSGESREDIVDHVTSGVIKSSMYPFGTSHPCNEDTSKATWTMEEINTVYLITYMILIITCLYSWIQL